MAHGLLLRIHLDHDIPVLVVAGDLDFSSAATLRLHGRELVDGALGIEGAPPVLVVDASQVEFVDSSGLGALVTLLKRTLAHRAGFSIAGARQPLRTRLASTGLDMVVALHPSVEEAVSAATGRPSGEQVTDGSGAPARPGIPDGGPPTGGAGPGDATGVR